MSAPIITWPGIGQTFTATVVARPDGTPTLTDIRPTSFVQEIDRIMADFERPRLTVVTGEEVEQAPRPTTFWRERQAANLRTQNAVLRRKIERIRRCRKK